MQITGRLVQRNFWIIFSLCAALCDSSAEQPRYKLIEIGKLKGTSHWTAEKINNAGEVIGNYLSINNGFYEGHGYLFSDNTIIDLPGGPAGLNDRGDVLVWAPTGTLLYSEGRWTDLTPLVLQSGSYNGFEGYAINNVGVIVGYFANLGGYRKPCIYVNNLVTELGSLPPRAEGVAVDINNRGQVIGNLFDGRALIFDGTNVVPVGALSNRVFSYAAAINDLGHVAGLTEAIGWRSSRPFLFRDGGTTLLPTLPASVLTELTDLNNRDQIVGYSRSEQGDVGVLFDHGVVYELNDLIKGAQDFYIFHANSINDDGWIAADAVRKRDQPDNGGTHAVILKPIR